MQQNRREQEGESAPYYPRYNESIRVFTLFFAAVLGFGLKHLLDLDTMVAQKPVGIFPFNGLPYKWLFFLVAIFIFLRFLTSSANHLWLEYQRDERAYAGLDNFLVIVSFFWLTVFACFGAYLCYAGTPAQFFRRAFYLLLAAFLASVIHVAWTGFKKWVLEWRTSRWQWALGWFVVNGIQLAVVVLLAGVPSWMWGSQLIVGWTVGGTWGTRLLVLAIVSAVILIGDFTWQLKQLSKPPPNPTTEARVHVNAAGIEARLRASLDDWDKERKKYKYGNLALALGALVSSAILVVYIGLKFFPTIGQSPFELKTAVGAVFALFISVGVQVMYQVPKRGTFYSTMVALGKQLQILLGRAKTKDDYQEIEGNLAALQIKAKQEIPAGASLTQVISDIEKVVPFRLPSEKHDS